MKDDKELFEEEGYDGKDRTKLFSGISLILGLLSLGFCVTFQITPTVLGTTGVVFAFISRKNLCYYDGLGLAGFVLSLIGTIIGTALFVLNITGTLSMIAGALM